MQLRTERGYDFFEAASASQKEIRSGNEESATYWAVELSGRYPDFAWYRLATTRVKTSDLPTTRSRS